MITTLNKTSESSEKIASLKTPSAVQNQASMSARSKRSQNMDRIINYKDYLKPATPIAPVENVVNSNQSLSSEEDLRPSVTTMQFANQGIVVENEKKAENTTDYSGSKSKMLVVVYSIVVAVILALIISNTSILANLSSKNAEKQAELTKIATEYNEVTNQYEELSSKEHVIKVAENEYNMVK